MGFPDNEEMDNENTSQTNSPSYINPFKKESEKPLPPPIPEVAKISQKDVEDSISDEVVGKVTAVLNTSLPEYVRECIDKDAQANYVRSLIGSTLTDFLQQIKQEAEESARQQWQKDRMDLANKSSEASKQMNEYKTKNEELRNRILSLDRQKSTLNDRISSLENRAATAEAEREQYQLECKSLMNKIKVAAVNDESLQTLRQDNDDLRSANESLQNEIAELKADAERKATESAAQILAAKADLAKKEALISELSAQPDDTNDKDAEIERLNTELEAVKNNAKTEAEALTARISALSQATIELEETKHKLAEAEAEKQALKNSPAASSEDLEKLQNELAVRDNELASMRSTIQSQNDELYALHEKLIEAGDAAKMAEIEASRANLNDTVEKLSNELSQKQLQIDDLISTKDEISSVYEQLKKELERNKKHYADKEQDFRQQIVALKDELETAKNEISIQKAEKKAKKKSQQHAVPASGISAIDYTTEYSDWLMPTPPTNAIPIVAEEPEETEIVNHKEPEKSHTSHNIPEQMELF